MSILSRPFERRDATSNISNPAAWFVNLFAGQATAAGIRVSPETALRATAVYACVRVLAETIGALPLHVYRRLPNGGKVRAPEHPLYSLLHDAPNSEMTTVEWREAGMGHQALRGNGYSHITFADSGPAAGRPKEITPMSPDRTRVYRDDASGEIRYDFTTEKGATRTYRHGEVLHERSFGGNGIIGYSPIRMAAEAIGISLAAEEFGARFFSNGAVTTGVLTGPDGVTMDDKAYDRLRTSFAEKQAGGKNAHRPLILEEGFKWQGIAMNNEQSQFIETRQFQLPEICRMFRVPPHMIADLTRSTNNNIEHQGIEFAIYSILPWLVRKEKRYLQDLILPSERGTYFVEHNLDALMRGDALSRAQSNQILRFNGVINANEWREMDNMNPYTGGEKYLVQSAMTPVEQVGKVPAPVQATRDMRRIAPVFLPVIISAAQRSIRKEVKALRALAKRADAPAAVAQFYGEQRTYLTEQIGPSFESLGLAYGTDITPLARSLSDTFCSEQQRLAESAVQDPAALDALLNHWEQARAAQFGQLVLTSLQKREEPAAA